MSEIKRGDVVYLNSGSPPLTVTYADAIDADVRWADRGGFQYETFPLVCLTQTAPTATTDVRKNFEWKPNGVPLSKLRRMIALAYV